MSSRRKPTLSDIARAANCSVATVSRAMSQPDLVQPATLDRVRAVAASLGYVPNRRARALVSGQSDTIGVVVPTLHSPIFSAALQDMQRTCSANGYQLLIASHDYNEGHERAAIGQLLSHGVDGLVVVGADRPTATWALIDGAGVPVVQMWEGRPDHDRVTVDNARAGYLVARHLCDIGHRRFGVICGHLARNDRQAGRLAGIRAALTEAGVTLAPTQVSEQAINIAAGRSGCMTLLEAVPRPTAIIGTADLLAIGAMFEAQARGVAVPEALSVAGIDNVDVAAHVSPSLTTVAMPADKIGAEAAALMLDRLRAPGDLPARHVELPVDLIVRHSTSRPAL